MIEMRGFLFAMAGAIALTMAGETSARANTCCDPGDGCDSMACMACDSDCCDCMGCDSACGVDHCGICGHNGARCKCMGRMKLLGCLRPSEQCFDDFISPMINFVYFEDPRTLTELRPIFVHHNLPGRLSSGAVQLLAAQFRIALTDRLSLIATKDGFIFDQVKDSALDTLLDDGWADVSIGLKYNLLRDAQSGTLASVGLTYELPIGSRSALQRIGDGEFHLFGTAGQRFLCGNAHWLTSVGWRKPVDGSVQTESIHWSNHFDVRVTDKTYLVTEIAWWHWTDSASTGLPLGVGGHDLFNLPVTNVDGNDLVTQNVGIKYKPNRHVEAGFAYEFPLTEFKDVIDNRFQFDLILRY